MPQGSAGKKKMIFQWAVISHRASLVAQMVKNLPAMQETWAGSLGQKEPLEKGMQSTAVVLPGEFHGQRRDFQATAHGVAKGWT